MVKPKKRLRPSGQSSEYLPSNAENVLRRRRVLLLLYVSGTSGERHGGGSCLGRDRPVRLLARLPERRFAYASLPHDLAGAWLDGRRQTRQEDRRSALSGLSEALLP